MASIGHGGKQAFTYPIGWMLPKYRHFLNIFKNWNRYNKMDVNRIAYKVLFWDSKQKVKSWTNELRNICRFLVCHEPRLNVLYDLKQIKKLLCKLQTSEWIKNVLSKPKLRHFKSYKTTFDAENYVCKYFPKRKRSLFAQLRVGILPLEIETGRYRNKPPENRFCPFCVNIPEDENHLICICPTYDVYREIMYDKITLNSPNFNLLDNENKFMYVMSCNDKCVLDYVEIAWSKKIALLYN